MNETRRVAFLSEHASPVALLGSEDAGGQNVYVDEVSRNLARQGYSVDVFTRRDDPRAPEVVPWASGVRIINLAAGPAEFLLKDQLWPYMPRFRDALLDFMARDGGYYDLIHGNFWMSGWVASELRRILAIPMVQIFHAMGKTKRRYQGWSDSSPGERIEIETAIIRDADRVIAQCPGEQAELIDEYGAEPRKVVLIPSAVNTGVFYPVERQQARRFVGIAPDNFVVVYVGRLLPRKDVRNAVQGVARLIKICQDLRPSLAAGITLLIVGGNTVEPDPDATPEIAELQQLARELDIERHVRFVGKRQQDQLRYYYSAGDVAVTTPWYEPFGLTPLEAMACGRPVIGSAVGGITYTVVDGETGFLVPPRDAEMLAAQLYHLLGAPELGERMGRAARRRVEADFTWPTVAIRTANLYEYLLTEANRGNGSCPDLSPRRGEAGRRSVVEVSKRGVR